MAGIMQTWCILQALGDHSQCWAAFDSPVGKHWVGNQHWSALICMLYKASLHTAACQTQGDIPSPGWELLGGEVCYELHQEDRYHSIALLIPS